MNGISLKAAIGKPLPKLNNSMKANSNNSITLNNGVNKPLLGLGTFPMTRTLYKTVPLAFLSGYRSFDTADAYYNESYLGNVLRYLPRKRLFITSKLSNAGQKRGDIKKELTDTLARLKTRYLDMYLMHWPVPELYLDSWKEMEKLYADGYIKAIGVCNCHEHHLDKLLSVAKVIPAINQIELHPLLSQKQLVQFCRKHNIAIEAYSPLARMDDKLIKNKILYELSQRHQVTVPQIILRWITQNGYCTCPKTSSFKRLRQNMAIFNYTLSNDDMEQIAELNENYRVRHNPDTADFDKL